MRALIYNELYKIVHKKITWIFVLFIFLQYSFNVFFIKANDNYLNNYDKTVVESLEKKHSTLGNDVKKDLDLYVSERNQIDAYYLYKDYDRLSWQRYLIDTDGMKYISCMNDAKIVKNDENRYQECKSNLDKLINKIKNSTWKDFIYEYQDDATNNLKELKVTYDNEQNEFNKKGIELSMEAVKLELDGYKYHLNNNIPIDYSDDSVMIDNYVDLATQHLSMELDESKYKDYFQLLEKRDMEKELYTSHYRVEHNYHNLNENTGVGLFIKYTCLSVNIIVLIYMIVVGGNLIADEFGKGTIKLLLVRPYKRTKILLSKYIATIISTLVFYLLYIGIIFIACGIAKGFSSYLSPIIVYDFSIGAIKEMSIISYLFINSVSYIPMFLVLLALTFFIGVFVKNEAMTVGIPIVVYIISLFLNYSSGIKIMKYFPTLCWNLNEFLWGGLPTYKELTFKTSFIVCIFTIVIITLGSLSVFKTRDIKNQ